MCLSDSPSQYLTSSRRAPHCPPTTPHRTPPCAPPRPPCDGRRREALGAVAQHGDPRHGNAGTDRPWCGNSGVVAVRILWHGGPDECSEADGTVGRWCGCAGHRGEDGVAAWRRLAASIGTATRRRHGGEIVGFVSPPMRRFSIRYTTGNLLQVITKVHNGEKWTITINMVAHSYTEECLLCLD
ncbi:uncharacterized protein LOC110431915 isoform X2 [Sorghum bicolor]|uniref:uncharacterized protein LOC110431915 isoform X2 n=1 Tax=Sorghum bicolor TaxID=4558 RepID=UPI000B4260ED|nr:uncharacterized protein LOC110431915 isoform X2 [Sorghum bicolor]|eukprot:XP_021307395.1 uncharacterized protein LOC110431915 isoform X2 [Sorghum bicolor]